MTTLSSLATGALLAGLTVSGNVSAVGGGLNFVFDEFQVPGTMMNMVDSDSLDFTYHSCIDFVQAKRFVGTGYLWISSFQDVDSVVDSQINYIDGNGYRMWAFYSYRGSQVGAAQPTPTGSRLSYLVAAQPATFVLYIDPKQDTTLTLVNCQVQVANRADDILVGSSNVVSLGEKSETDGLANGDFELIFRWTFTAVGKAIFNNPADFNFLSFNGNVTTLDAALGVDHFTEGSGNLFWLRELPKP